MAISPWLLLHIPTAILGLLMVGLSAVLPMTGLLVVRRRGPLMPLGSDNEVARSPRFEPSETPRVGKAFRRRSRRGRSDRVRLPDEHGSRDCTGPGQDSWLLLPDPSARTR